MVENFGQTAMQRCMHLALKGLGTTYPNPLVGAVIVHKGNIIGEGWHVKAGEPHAEVLAIASVKDKSLLAESTLYVNLEPCHHYGKTPPCTKAICDNQIPRVVIGCRDTAAHVNGKGMAFLREQGVHVALSTESNEAQWLNRRFFIFQNKKRPYLVLKWAQTANGFFAPIQKEQCWISGTPAKQLVHKWRSEEQAILIGKTTALIDNPRLDVRLWEGHHPTRILIDPTNEVPLSSTLFANHSNVIVFNQTLDKREGNIEWISIDFAKQDALQTLLTKLHQLSIQSVLIEGGALTLSHFINENLWDEARVFTAPIRWKTGIEAPKIKAAPFVTKQIGKDQLCCFKNETR